MSLTIAGIERKKKDGKIQSSNGSISLLLDEKQKSTKKNRGIVNMIQGLLRQC